MHCALINVLRLWRQHWELWFHFDQSVHRLVHWRVLRVLRPENGPRARQEMCEGEMAFWVPDKTSYISCPCASISCCMARIYVVPIAIPAWISFQQHWPIFISDIRWTMSWGKLMAFSYYFNFSLLKTTAARQDSMRSDEFLQNVQDYWFIHLSISWVAFVVIHADMKSHICFPVELILYNFSMLYN